mmetsp:Transcript_7654/g.1071  ORF Transcript_7654/g.1071 Transcript_7654/m.1071 type:complete len:110 (+) Transcript_7654:24-353(+)
MNKKIATGIIVLLGVFAVLAMFSNNEIGQQLKTHKAIKSHKWGWLDRAKAKAKQVAEDNDPGCQPSDAFTQLCTTAGGFTCNGNRVHRSECCDNEDDCESHSSFWGSDY